MARVADKRSSNRDVAAGQRRVTTRRRTRAQHLDVINAQRQPGNLAVTGGAVRGGVRVRWRHLSRCENSVVTTNACCGRISLAVIERPDWREPQRGLVVASSAIVRGGESGVVLAALALRERRVVATETSSDHLRMIDAQHIDPTAREFFVTCFAKV